MYNHDVLGSRYNQGEKAIGRDNAGRLEEKWRFPAKGSGQEIGAIHATPVVVDGYVYFGTASATPTILQADARRQGPLVLPQSRDRARAGSTRGGAGRRGDSDLAPPAVF